MGSGDYNREGNRCNHGGVVVEGDGESKPCDGEEVERLSHKFQVYGPLMHIAMVKKSEDCPTSSKYMDR